MRELRFRAWTKDKQMKYNVVPFQWDYCINTMWHKCIKSNGPGILGHGGTEAEFEVGGFSIIDGALMQWTGLKDRNRKDIFESDVIRFLNGQTTSTENGMECDEFPTDGAVFWDDEYAQWDISGRIDVSREDVFMDISSCEVVGDIYTTPDLLK